MRFHVLGIPHTVTSKDYNACAFTQKVFKFGKMMKARGHTIIHYGHPDSDLECTENVPVVTNEDLEVSYGNHDWKKEFFKYEINDYVHKIFRKNAIREIQKRKQKNDFILPFWGIGHKEICDFHDDLITVEPGIGYADQPFAKWKVFESYAIYHAYCGLNAVKSCSQEWYDVVIPNYFDPDDFDYCEDKADYFLYLGRVYEGKGVNIAIQVTEKLGKKLIIAGQTDGSIKFPPHVEYIGYADVKTRRKIMAKAVASFVPSLYLEPFGGVVVENYLSGTPVITTDWGGFTENVVNGVTGFRCRTFNDFCEAAQHVGSVKSIDCRNFAMERYSLDKVGTMYEKYFQDVLNVYGGKGWYTEGGILPLGIR